MSQRGRSAAVAGSRLQKAVDALGSVGLVLLAGALISAVTLFPARLSAAALVTTTFDGRQGVTVIRRDGVFGTVQVAQGVTDQQVLVRVATDKQATGRGQSAVVIARQANRAEYRAGVRFLRDGRVEAHLARHVNGVRSDLVAPAVLSGLRHSPGTRYSLLVEVRGTSPAVLRLKVWAAGTQQPAKWMVTAKDGAPALRAGRTALRFGVLRTASNTPVRFDYADVEVSATSGPVPSEPAPVPTATPVATPTVAPTPSASVAATPNVTVSPTPSPTVAPTPSATPSPAATPTTAPLPLSGYFVAPQGDDANPGSLSAPWRTIQKAVDSVSAGATIYIRDGTYSPFTMRRSGTASAPITLAAYPGEKPIVDGRDAATYTARLSGVSNVRVIGLTVQGGYAERQNGGGLIVENSSRVEIRDSTFRHNSAFGLRIYNSRDVHAVNNVATRNAVGIQVHHGGAGVVVAENRVHDNDRMMVNTADVRGDDSGAQGIVLVRTTGHVLVTRNRVWGNRAPSYDYGVDGAAFEIFAASNWEFTDNVSWDNRNVLETGTDQARTPCDNGRFTRNVSYGATTTDRTVGMILRCASNTLVANNTFDDIQYFVFAIEHMKGNYGGSIEGLRIINNVVTISTGKVYGIDTEMPAGVVIDHNLVFNTGTGPLATVVGRGGTRSLAQFNAWTGFEASGLVADPRYLDAAARDYRLRGDSPAIDSGATLPGVTDGFSGTRPDRGRWEYVR
jgi:hypothetical protein